MEDKKPITTTTVTPTHKTPSEMTPEERLASMRAFAEEQKYIQPGGGEILPWNSGMGPAGGYNASVFSNPDQGGSFSFKMAPGYQGHLAAPREKAVEEEKPRRESVWKRMMGKHEHGHSHGHGEEGVGDAKGKDGKDEVAK